MWSTFSTYQLLFGELTIFEIHVQDISVAITVCTCMHFNMKNLKFVVLTMCHVKVKNVELNVLHFMNLAENKE